VPPLAPLVYPPQPVYQEPEAPKGAAGAFGGKKRHEREVAAARADYPQSVKAWQARADVCGVPRGGRAAGTGRAACLERLSQVELRSSLKGSHW